MPPNRESRSDSHRPSAWLRYLVKGGSAATIVTVFFLYTNLSGNSPKIEEEEVKKKCNMPFCGKFMDEVIIALVNTRMWLFGTLKPDLDRYKQRKAHPEYSYPPTKRPKSPTYRGYYNYEKYYENEDDEEEHEHLFTMLTRISFYASIVISAFILYKIVRQNKMKRFVCAVTPPFIAAFLQTSDSSSSIDKRDETDVSITQDSTKRNDYADEVCRTHAYRVEEMAKAIEYLAKVNNQREKEITKLSMKNDYLAESLARVYKYNKRMQSQIGSRQDDSSTTGTN